MHLFGMTNLDVFWRGHALSGFMINTPIAGGADKAKGGHGHLGYPPFGLDKRYFESLLIIAVGTVLCHPSLWFCQFIFALISSARWETNRQVQYYILCPIAQMIETQLSQWTVVQAARLMCYCAFRHAKEMRLNCIIPFPTIYDIYANWSSHFGDELFEIICMRQSKGCTKIVVEQYIITTDVGYTH